MRRLEADVRPPIAIEFGLQPVLMIGVLLGWYLYRDSPVTYVIAIGTVQLILGVVEYLYPARRDWMQSWREKAGNVLLVVALVTLTGEIAVAYDRWLAEPLAELRQAAGFDIWPHTWPLLVQLLMVWLLSELIWYWVHRAQHRWAPVWKLSGHGSHHAFKKLGAINFGLNHPLEAFFLVAPSALVELFFGVGIAAAGAAIFGATLASIAHANVRTNSAVIGWVFTTNEYHIHHHSVVLAESNTNYGCSAIVWDRLFRTFLPGPTAETGVGPTEPTLWEKFLMPVREPRDTTVAPTFTGPEPP